MFKKQMNNQGFIAIISLLIIGTISMIITLSLLSNGVDNAALSLHSIYYEDARMNSTICVEDTLYRIKLESQFAGNVSYTLDTNQSCTASLLWYTPQQVDPQTVETLVDMVVTGTAENFVRTFNYALKVTKHTVNHTDGTVEYTNTININSVEEVTS